MNMKLKTIVAGAGAVVAAAFVAALIVFTVSGYITTQCQNEALAAVPTQQQDVRLKLDTIRAELEAQRMHSNVNAQTRD